jgi:hypothetical protein
MKYKDFILKDVAFSIEHARRIIPPKPEAIERAAKATLTLAETEIEFLRRQGLIRSDSKAFISPIEETVLRLSDLTEEGQDFVMSQATVKWVEACSRKSNDMLKRGASEEERLAVYADPKGLHSRLEKFRKERAAKAH